METTPTPFDLNRAVQQWRDNLEQSPAFRRDNLEELETHLRDSVAYLQQRGLAADEAFLIATRRVGTDAALGTEFGKTNTHGVWVDRGLGMLAGIQIYGCIGQLMSTATSGIMLGVSEIKPLEPTTLSYLWGGLVCGLAHLLIFAAVLTGELAVAPAKIRLDFRSIATKAQFCQGRGELPADYFVRAHGFLGRPTSLHENGAIHSS